MGTFRTPVGPEYREPASATLPLRFISPGQPQVPEWNADRAIRHGLLGSVWVYRCAHAIASSLAGLPFRAGPDPDDRTNFNTNARLAQLLGPPPGGPAPKLTGRRLLEYSIVQLLITGRFGWEVETTQPRGRGDVVALWPLVSSHLEAVPTKSGSSWFSGFLYGANSTEKVHLAPESVVYMWRPSAKDFRQPESVLEAARYDVSLDQGYSRYALGFLRNNAMPAGVVVLPEFADEKAFEAFKRQWGAEHGGPDAAGKLAFLELDPDSEGGAGGAIDVKTLGLSQVDAQMLEQQSARVDAICAAFGVPKSILGVAEGNTFANAEMEARSFWRETMLPLIEDLTDVINLELAPRVGTELGWFDTSNVAALQTTPVPVTAPVGAPEMVQARLMTVDEGRADYRLPPLPNGEGARLMTVDEIAALTPQGATPAPSAVSAGRTAPVLPTAHRGARVAVDRAERRDALWRSADRLWSTYETQWERQLRRLFERQKAATLKRLEAGARRKAWTLAGEARAWDGDIREATGGLFEPDFWAAETATDLRSLYEAVATGTWARLTDQLGVSFDLEAEFAQEFITSRANQLAGYVTQTTYQQITETMAEGVGAGESIDDLAARIEAVFADAVGNRATVIARTEVVSASNASGMEAVSTLGADVVAAKEWVAARDSRTRDSHGSADGEVVPVAQPFSVGGASMQYPGDPSGPASETINCRCALAFLTPEEVAQ